MARTQSCGPYPGVVFSTHTQIASCSFFGEGSPTKKDYRKISGALILTSLLEDLVTDKSPP